MRAVYDRFTSSDNRVAFLRTYAPAVWSAIVFIAADLFGADIPGKPLDSVAPLALFAFLYWIGKRFPKVEALLLGVAVEAQAYTKRGEVDVTVGRDEVAAGLRDSMTLARIEQAAADVDIFDYDALPVTLDPEGPA